jgi:hypothetical protein
MLSRRAVVSVFCTVESGLLLLIDVVSPGLVVAGSGVSQAKTPVNKTTNTVITVFIIEIFS